MARLKDWEIPSLHTRDPFAALQMLHLEKVVGIICRRDLPLLSGEELCRRAARGKPSLIVKTLSPPSGGEFGGGEWEHGKFTFREADFIGAVGSILLASGMLLNRDRFSDFLSASPRYPEILGQSGAIREVFALMDKVKDQEVTILIRGESGTGKELVAEAVHRCGSRAGRQFISVNCAAIPETLLESELFGHEKGAFTGADTRVVGRFEQANGGCLFLDEIGDMSFKTQAKILRLLEGHEFERVGGREKIRVDVRIIAATNRDLEEAVRENNFREDLYYRIGAFPIFLPPLRARPEDIPLLAAGMLSAFNQGAAEPITGMTPRAIERLSSQSWPGNVRQLENTIHRAAILTGGGMIGERQLSLEEDISPGEEPAGGKIEAGQELPRIRSLSEVEREAIASALRIAGGNISQAARGLGIARATLYKKIREYNLDKDKSIDRTGG